MKRILIVLFLLLVAAAALFPRGESCDDLMRERLTDLSEPETVEGQLELTARIDAACGE